MYQITRGYSRVRTFFSGRHGLPNPLTSQPTYPGGGPLWNFTRISVSWKSAIFQYWCCIEPNLPSRLTQLWKINEHNQFLDGLPLKNCGFRQLRLLSGWYPLPLEKFWSQTIPKTHHPGHQGRVPQAGFIGPWALQRGYPCVLGSLPRVRLIEKIQQVYWFRGSLLKCKFYWNKPTGAVGLTA